MARRLTLSIGLLLVAVVAFACAAPVIYISSESSAVWNGDCGTTACSSAQPCSFSATTTAFGSGDSCRINIGEGSYGRVQINAVNRELSVTFTGHIQGLNADFLAAHALSFAPESSALIENSLITISKPTAKAIDFTQLKLVNSYIRVNDPTATLLSINFARSLAVIDVAPGSPTTNPFPALFSITSSLGIQSKASLNLIGSSVELPSTNAVGLLSSFLPIPNVALTETSSVSHAAFIAYVTPSRATTVSLTSGSSLKFVKNVFFGPAPFAFTPADGNLLLTRTVEGNTNPIVITGYTYTPSANARKAAMGANAFCVGLSLTNTHVSNLDIQCGYESAYNCPFLIKDSVISNSNLCLKGPSDRFNQKPRPFAAPQLENSTIEATSNKVYFTLDNVDLIAKDLTVLNKTGSWNYDYATGGSLVFNGHVVFLPESTKLNTNAIYVSRGAHVEVPSITFLEKGSFFFEPYTTLKPAPSSSGSGLWTFNGDTVFQPISLTGGFGPAAATPIIDLSSPARIFVSENAARKGASQIASRSTSNGPQLIINNLDKWFQQSEIVWNNIIVGETPSNGKTYTIIKTVSTNTAGNGPFTYQNTGAPQSMRGYYVNNNVVIGLQN